MNCLALSEFRPLRDVLSICGGEERCASEPSVPVMSARGDHLTKRKDFFWLTILKVLIHDGLAIVLVTATK